MDDLLLGGRRFRAVQVPAGPARCWGLAVGGALLAQSRRRPGASWGWLSGGFYRVLVGRWGVDEAGHLRWRNELANSKSMDFVFHGLV